MLVSPLPTWKQLLLPCKYKNGNYWKEAIWLSRTGVSIRILIDTYKKVFGKESVNVWIPDYFCAETEQEFNEKGVELVRYPITKALEPNWDKIKQMVDDNVDIFIFVHYFGDVRDISKAREFCNRNNAMLIEDCAHVLYQYGKIGQKGDFVLYSPHKLLPVPDGAIIQCNAKDNDKYLEMYALIQSAVGEPKAKWISNGIWKIKKIIQKIVRASKPVRYMYGEHYLGEQIEKERCLSISKWSYKIIQGLSYEDLKIIAYIRRDNMQMMTYLLLQIEPELIPITTQDNECPFFAVYSLEKVKSPAEVIKKIQSLGINVMYWPSLSEDVQTIGGIAPNLSRELFVVPIHQGITPQQIAKKDKDSCTMSTEMLELCRVGTEERERWNNILRASKLSNITQDWYYGDVKCQVEGWGIDRIIITKNHVDIGVVQVLKKKILGMTIAVRINKGPILVEGEDSLENELAAVDAIRKKYYHVIPFFYVPFSIMSEKGYATMVKTGWRNWDIFGFPTGTVDLTRSEEVIRASLDSKWRNQLKTAEKNGYDIKCGLSRFDEMMKLYEMEQQEKSFVGVKTALLEAMSNIADSPLRVFFVENEKQELIAYDIFYRHGNDATYYVGWNSNEGRKKYLNNLLLYHAAIKLKEEGVRVLDLGGIEYIHTESIAKFKDGMNPTHFRQMGEFIKI